MKSRLYCFFFILLFNQCKPNQNYTLDVGNNSYQTKVYNNKIWLTENLRVTKDREGQELSFYYPNDDSSNVQTYGLLYDYETACQVCPQGWRLPSNEDWEELFESLEDEIAHKFKDEQFWEGEQNSNESGFSIRPTGYGNNGEFDNYFQSKTLFWSSSKDNAHDVWTYIIELGKKNIRKAPQHPTYAFSVRCVKEL